MKVHHLNCGTMTRPGPMVCHVLVVETDGGLVLVDSGYGTDDCDTPAESDRRAEWSSLRSAMTKPSCARSKSSAFTRDDVRHIIITHMDMDHVGGLSDFPGAQVHLIAAEALGAIWAPSRREKIRYRSKQWAHNPSIVEISPGIRSRTC
jgi:glyoxylase-like metal-dependent hydrolase (beta-lactamase superfamily II)